MNESNEKLAKKIDALAEIIRHVSLPVPAIPSIPAIPAIPAIPPDKDGHEELMTQLDRLNIAVFGDSDNLGMRDKVDEMYDLVKGAKFSWKVGAWIVATVMAVVYAFIYVYRTITGK